MSAHDKRKDLTLSNSLWAPYATDTLKNSIPLPIAANSIGELFLQRAEESPERLFARYNKDQHWKEMSWGEAAKRVSRVARFLTDSLAVKGGERVAVLSFTRLEWLLSDLAILSAGAISTPVYHSITAAEVGYILWDSDARIVFAENQEQLDKLLALAKAPVEIPETEGFAGGALQLEIKHVICFEDVQAIDAPFAIHRFSDLLRGDGVATPSSSVKIEREALACIVYTSGTTGPPKGVVQSHGNHIAMLDAVVLSGLMGSGEGIFLFLPLAHSFARLIAYAPLAAGGSLIFPTVVDKNISRFHPKQVFADASKTAPLIFPSVPRLFEKVMGQLRPAPKSKKFLHWAVAQYQRYLPSKGKTQQISLKAHLTFLVSEIVVEAVKKKIFGNRLRYCISGGAPISMEVLEFFRSIGVMIYEGYGLTETCPATNVNTERYCRFGTVGRPFPGVEQKIAESDGEILVRGPNIALGYWNKPQATAEVFLPGGWFATGDIGEIDEEGYLKITDRKKDLIVTAGGKKIPPALIEGLLKNSPFISHAMVYGDRKPYLVSLVTLDEPMVRGALRLSNEMQSEQLVALAAVKELVAQEVTRINQTLASFEQIKKFQILTEDFTPDNGFLSPSLKLKRKSVLGRYLRLIEELYGDA